MRKEVKISIVVIATIIIFLWGMSYLKGKDIFTKTYIVYVQYDDISGLAKSNNVLLKGYKVGVVSNIIIDPSATGKVTVELSIEKRIPIPKGSFAVLSSEMLGTKFISLEFMPNTIMHVAGDTLLPKIEKSLLEEIDPLRVKIEETFLTLNSVLGSVDSILNPNSIAHLQNSLQHIDEFTGTLADQKQALSLLMANLAQFSTSLNNSRADLQNTLSNLSSVSDSLQSANLKGAIEKADSTLLALNLIMAKINESQGTLGMLVNDKALYTNLNQASQQLDSLLADLKKHPKRYVHFSVFGSKEK